MKKNILYLILSTLLIIAGYNFFSKKIVLSGCVKYTLATPIKINCTGKTGTCSFLSYSIRVNHQMYVSESGIDADIRQNNTDKEIIKQKYLVSYKCDKPNISEILWEYKVPNNTETKEWDAIPVEIVKK